MREMVSLTGMVLSAMPVGDYDKRMLVLTRERGKITVFARGARRQGSGYLAACDPFVFGTFEVYEGKNAYNLGKVTVKKYFRELAGDLDCACYGFYFLEMATYYTQENMDAADYLNLLYLTLLAVLNTSLDNRLVRRIYELRVLVIQGEYPGVFSCMKCGRKESLDYFSFDRHGVLCPDCLKGEHAIPLDASTRYALQYIISSPLEQLYTFAVSDAVFARLDEIISRYIRRYNSHEFKSEELLP